MNWLQKILNWVWARLQERSTQTALVGLLTVLFAHLDIPAEIQSPLATFITTFFFTVAVAKG